MQVLNDAHRGYEFNRPVACMPCLHLNIRVVPYMRSWVGHARNCVCAPEIALRTMHAGRTEMAFHTPRGEPVLSTLLFLLSIAKSHNTYWEPSWWISLPVSLSQIPSLSFSPSLPLSVALSPLPLDHLQQRRRRTGSIPKWMIHRFLQFEVSAEKKKKSRRSERGKGTRERDGSPSLWYRRHPCHSCVFHQAFRQPRMKTQHLPCQCGEQGSLFACGIWLYSF